jgi:hypothetical protein
VQARLQRRVRPVTTTALVQFIILMVLGVAILFVVKFSKWKL